MSERNILRGTQASLLADLAGGKPSRKPSGMLIIAAILIMVAQ
jgi:hypothetical protein